jgi:hypothetical protein
VERTPCQAKFANHGQASGVEGRAREDTCREKEGQGGGKAWSPEIPKGRLGRG